MNKKNKTREIAINHHHKYAKIDVFNNISIFLIMGIDMVRLFF